MREASETVHVVDDDASFLKAVARLLRAAGLRVQGYASATEFLAKAGTIEPGCVLVDLRMPGMSGLDLQATLAAMPDRLPVVFLSAHGDVPSTVKAMKQGADDFLEKQAPKDELLAAVRRALDRGVRERAEQARRRELAARLTALTHREQQVLSLVLEGKPNKQIASELGIHERTVKFHRTSITTKLEVRSVAQLARLVQDARHMP